MKVLVVEPGQYARQTDIPSTLKAEQELVGGMIEAVYPWQDHVCLVCNEEGLVNDLPLNRYIPELGEPIHGTFFICGLEDGNFTDLTAEQLVTYESMFRDPQVILPLKDRLAVIVCDPDTYAEIIQSFLPNMEP